LKEGSIVGRTEVYYFTGTGNSLAVARDMAEKLKARLTPVTLDISQEGLLTQADTVGFVFPVYDFKPPPVVEEVIRQSQNLSSRYLFAACTYGIAPSQSLRHLEKVIVSRGGQLAAGFAVGMPHNGIGCSAVSEGEHKRLFKNWKGRSREICEYIEAKEKGRIESSSLFSGLSGNLKMAPTLFRFLGRVLLKGINSLALTASNDCNGCGICARICPMHNIEIVSDKPTWADRCASCFACLHWCPKGAVSLGGFDADIRPYHHPDVKISDLIRYS
jgi:ferredoxin